MSQFYEVTYASQLKYNRKPIYTVYGEFVDNILVGRYMVNDNSSHLGNVATSYTGHFPMNKPDYVGSEHVGYLKLVTNPRRLKQLKKIFGEQ